mgnify:CR=1 FL=1|tara:strand:+ start:731 stop:868 length:138 start_codon:yes stop_codon:yes gene_type:complete
MKVEVEIKRNGHILLNGELIAILGQWNRYEDIEETGLTTGDVIDD